MSYSTTTIGSLLDEVNRHFFLPAIQRPYVWSSHQVIALFDSLLKGYPISSFMFWAVDETTKNEVKIYRFIENYRADARNEPTRPSGQSVTLVLDGQQRLTSLLIGLKGTYAEKQKHARRNNPDAWSEKSLYLDILKDADDLDDEEDVSLGVTYGLKFLATEPRNNHRHHWIRLGTMLDYQDAARFEHFLERTLSEVHHGVPPYERELAETTLRKLHAVIWQDEAVNYYTERDQSSDRVLEIFVRANDGGVKLSKSDLLMSMVTSKWSSGSAREDILGFIDFINKGLSAPNKIQKDFVLKACLVLGGFDVTYNVSNFTNEAIARIEAMWPSIKAAIERTFRLLNRFGINEKNLTSLNAVLPIAFYLYRTPEFTFLGSSAFETLNARAIRRWLINSLLIGAFAGQSDRTIALARHAIQQELETSRNFPIDRLFRALATHGRLSQLDARAVEEVLNLKYGKAKTFLALSLMYDDADWSDMEVHVDHIIPEAEAKRRVLMAQNLPEHRIREITDSVNRLGNLQFLPGSENIEKSDIPFASWITGRNREYLQRHMIPERPDLWMPAQLPEFVREREKLIRQRLLNLSPLESE